MASSRKKVNKVQEAVERILKDKNQDFNEWKKTVITKKKIEVMSDEDKDWTERTLNEASLELIMNEVIKGTKSTVIPNENKTAAKTY